jgi:hypothetical protein
MSGDIVGVRLQNTGTMTQSSGYATFGEVFALGAVNPTDSLVARINGINYAVQMDVKSTNADGSVRQAILTLDAPAIAAGGNLDLMLSKGAAAAPFPAAPSASALLASGYDTTVNLTFHNPDGTTTTASASAHAALQAALNAGTVQTWLNGSGVNEYDVVTTVNGGKLKVEFDIRAYADGTTKTDVIFDNSWLFSPGKTDLTYDVSISQAGQVYAATGVQQYLYSLWHHEVDSAGTINPNVQYDVPYLEGTGAVPAYDTSIGAADAGIQSSFSGLNATNTGPMGTAGVTTYMPMTGARPDIGTQPNWVAEWLVSQNATAQQVMMADADASGGVPWHFTDENTGKPISLQTYPNFWDDYRGRLVPANGWPNTGTGADPWIPDPAHMPDLNYVTYLTSGSHYQLELLQAQADFALTASNSGYGDSTWTLPATTAQSVVGAINVTRAIAWSLREVAEAAYITPDNDPLKPYFVSQLNTNMNSLVTQYIKNGADSAYGQLSGFIQGLNIHSVAPWQQGYIVTVLGDIAAMNIPQASANAVAMLNYMNNFVSGLYTNGTNGYSPLDGAGYWLNTDDPTTGAPYTTWAQFYQGNVAAGNIVPQTSQLGGYPTDTGGGYPVIARAALADLITYTQSPQAIQAYGYVASQIAYSFSVAGQSETAAYQLNLQWSQMPRLPDGTWLQMSQMQIDTSDAASVTLTAKDGDSLLSVVGSGTAVLNGGTGSCDLLFGGSGPTTLNAGTGNDYLFAGSGPTMFNDNIGHNYMHGGTGANAYVFGESHSGHDTIANFNAATDTLRIGANLNGNGITTASQLIAGATVNNGNAVFHLSPNDDITLLGVNTPSSLLNSILVS